MKQIIKKILGRDKLNLIHENLSQVDAKLEHLSKGSERLNEVLENKVTMLKKDLHSEVLALKKDLHSEVLALREDLRYINFELLNLPKTDKRKVLIVGFYGAPNLGDELMLETLLQYFESREDIQITVMLCNNPDYDIRKYKDINFIHYPKNIFDINSIAGYFDTIIFGGGAIIDDGLYDKSNPNYDDLGTILIDLSTKSILWGKKLYCIALSSNTELKNKDFIDSLSYIIENAKHFSIRDENSLQTLSNLGFEMEGVVSTNDIALGNKDIKQVNIKNDGKLRNIGVNLICNSETISILKIFLDKIIVLSRGKANINLIPFYDYHNNDIHFYNELIKNNKYKDIKITPFPKTMKGLIKVLRKQDCIISMRYHCSLLSLAIGIPTQTISYDIHKHYPNKINYLMKLLGGGEKAISFLKIKERSYIPRYNKRNFTTSSRKERCLLITEVQRYLSSLIEDI